ncbi:MAG: DUF4136 domain-containing protein [Gammaproteobacteria bacterium]|nr:DUF4136 domain-containing protein [Gammaproteobacteria bacterium]
MKPIRLMHRLLSPLLKFALIFGSLLFLNACTHALKPVVLYDDNIAFDQYKSFAWASDKPYSVATDSTTTMSPMLLKKIQNSIEEKLIAKGYAKTNTEANPAIIVSFTVGSRDKIQIDTYPNGFFYGARSSRNRSGSGYGFWGNNIVDAYSYREGTLTIDIFDAQSKEPIWSGAVSKKLYGDVQNRADAIINDVVNTILTPFPPQPKTK